jgi:DNA-binding transcriptional LysR family regulator
MLQRRKACIELLQSGEGVGLLPDGYIPEDIVLRRILAADNYYDDISEGELMADWC